MIHLNILTGARKIMNMAKLGTVAQSKSGPAKGANPRKQRAFGMTWYTLCEYQGKAKRNSSRHGFAFDILRISRLASGSGNSGSGNSGQRYGLSNTVPLSHHETSKTTQNTPQSLTGCGFLPRKITVPAFTLKTAKNASKCSNSLKSLKTGLFSVFQAVIAWLAGGAGVAPALRLPVWRRP
jgi:hypothetical protein